MFLKSYTLLYDTFIYLAVDGALYLWKHLLNLTVHHSLNHSFMIGEVLQMLCDETTCGLLFITIFHHRLLQIGFDGAKVLQKKVSTLVKTFQLIVIFFQSYFSRYCEGVIPYIRLKVCVKLLASSKPHLNATSTIGISG